MTGITEDATNTPAVKETSGSTSANQTTASFSPAAGTLVVVLVSIGYSSANATGPTVTVTDSLSNSYAAGPAVYSTRADCTGIFTYYYASAPGSITVTATRNLTAAAGFQVAARCVLGAAVSQAGAASVTYFENLAGENKSATGAIVTTVTGSQVYLCATHNTNEAVTPAAGTTTILSTSDSSDGETLTSGKAASLTGTPGSTTLGWTFGTNSTWALSLLEILPAASTPAPAAVTASAAFPAPAVTPVTIAHIGDSAIASGSSSTLISTYATAAGRTLAAYVVAYVSGNNPITLTGVTDTAGNTWTVVPGAGSYYSGGGLYGYCAIAFCVNAAAVTSVTAHFSRLSSSVSLVVSQFSGVPAGYGLELSQALAESGSATSLSTPAIGVPMVPAIILGATAAGSNWTGVSPGTPPVSGHMTVWEIVTSGGSQAFTFTSGSSNHPMAAMTAAIGPPLATPAPATVTAAAVIPVPLVTGWPLMPPAVTVTVSIPGVSVSPAQIFHVGDSAPYSGSDSSAIVAYNNVAGNMMTAYIAAYNDGNNPGTITGVFDDAGNTWTIAQGGASYDATTGLYGYTAIACCVSALAMNYITVYYSDMISLDHANIQISEFAGVPAGSTPAAIAIDSPDTVTASYAAPAVTVPAGAYLILSAVASDGPWSGITPGTAIDSSQASWCIVTAAGSYAPACTGAAQTVYGAVTLAIGFAAPVTTALFTPVGSWMGANSGSLPAQFQAAGNLVVVKVSNTSDGTVYCTGLTSSNATWTPAGTPFFGTVNAMTATAFTGTVTAAGADTIVPVWSGATPSSWVMAGHEFIAAAGWRFDAQAGLDSDGTSTWTPITPSTGAGELYFGHATAASPSAGSTPGYVYNINIGGSYISAAYNSAAT